jgi:hypothetical protein
MSTVLNKPSSQVVSIPSLITVVVPKISTTTFARRTACHPSNEDEASRHQLCGEYDLSDKVLYGWNQSL